MGTISITLPSDGSTADVADYNAPLTTVVNVINGGLDNANIAAAAAIDGNKLADSSITNAKLAPGMVVQVVDFPSSLVATGTTIIPLDDTIPQITEGTEFMTLSITPKSATNKLIIEVVAALAHEGSAENLSGAIFQDATVNALAANSVVQLSANGSMLLIVKHSMVAGTTSATTFRFRAGAQIAGTITFNGRVLGRLFGGITKSSIVITEYKA